MDIVRLRQKRLQLGQNHIFGSMFEGEVWIRGKTSVTNINTPAKNRLSASVNSTTSGLDSLNIQSTIINDETLKEQGWQPVYLVVQGKRVMWYKSEQDCDNGGTSEGMISLLGHAGLTSASPLEIKELGIDIAKLLVVVFGKNIEKQQEKISILLPDLRSKDLLESEIMSILDYKQD